ncbi:hypothetical protein G7092_29375 [Mucilaginibacter sp. HC2]|uniref:hypothetical protein n=1 Tax=Mucilaginibacter inviolabilis TaxID=2714892 RepID=UPI00140AB853|nr:hypothetical protein [Mucilaginibacter inviolabilis]NHA07947.1 hypothetical protein [Mucilaginibacter inviolabilis]
MNKIQSAKAWGYAASNLLGMILIGLNKLLLVGSGLLVFSEFVIIPILMGIINAYFLRNLYTLKTRKLIGISCINGMIAIVLSYIFLKEGTICLIIVSPLLFCFIFLGILMGRGMFHRDNDTLNVSIISLLLLIFVADSVSMHHYENMVSDKIVINAPVTEVWKHVVAYKRIKAPEKFWLFKIGMPSPVESTADGYYLGAKRKCIFSNGYVFDEKIVTYDKDKNLTFDITHQPRDPEIMGHIDILRGQFLLKDNGNNTTTLVGNSWYKLYVFPAWYYDIWAQSITRNVHMRVMEHIKQLSEEK